MKSILGALSCAFLVSAASAQVASTVGPPVAPVGCPIAITLSNDTLTTVWTGICPFVVRDGSGQIVFAPICIAIARAIPPGETFTTGWPQIDNDNRQVAAGTYTIDVFLPTGRTAHHPVTIDAQAQGGVAPLGVVRTGTTRHVYACSPATPGDLHLMAAALSASTGFATCGGPFPLDPDLLFALSLQPNPVFLGFTGTFDPDGITTAPAIAMPANPVLLGFTFHLAFLAVDLGASCPFTAISAATPVVVQ